MYQSAPVAAYIQGGKSLHLNHGPIDLVIRCEGSDSAVAQAYIEMQQAFNPLLTSLVEELPMLRRTLTQCAADYNGDVARRMNIACQPFWQCNVSAMASVAGAVADHILASISDYAELTRVWINNGGDIALYLAPEHTFSCGVIGSLSSSTSIASLVLSAEDNIFGIATSGQAMSDQGGRSFSLGIADSVTVLAHNAATADVAATLIANRVDIPGHNAIRRIAAKELDPDSDLGEREVTIEVAYLEPHEVDFALNRGADLAQQFVSDGLINQAFLSLQGKTQHIARSC